MIDEVTTRKPGPQGPNVADALVLPTKGAEPFRHVLGVIEALHGDGKLPKTTVHASQKRSAYGWYTHYNPAPYGRTKPSEIHYLAPLAKGKLGHPELTLAPPLANRDWAVRLKRVG